MSDKPIDPAQESINQSQTETSSYEGQQGYGVRYEDGQYQEGSQHGSDVVGRSGSFETSNTGGYGQNDPNPEQTNNPPDPQADQGQGGQ